jgi:hypothetical protein
LAISFRLSGAQRDVNERHRESFRILSSPHTAAAAGVGSLHGQNELSIVFDTVSKTHS